ncbi:uncharacterized protein Z518_10397 [Rhinocladiella mackenziei CBS 650.93]|uniref:DCG1-like protein n=1 Tax=Rhinocladiella mackenziei CBS 650.93 TaxID=1442369 RepID=A0A0D2GPG4_9EURO|nr:uncharacterized protein Z518_10397 [Rhinocladiella mackenziei CBS 650.93]KIX00258.1 hypothetical protein Z518_10397 [Rhinocladiella mackenziei CBS 650.93]
MANEHSHPVRILIINPNASTHMTDALKPVVDALGYPSAEYTYFTSPSPGIPSINSPSDAATSAEICLPALIPLLAHHDAFLVACYSEHPLVPLLKRECAALTGSATSGTQCQSARKHVTGIFEASILSCLSLLTEKEDGFGIVSTGKVWEEALPSAVESFLGIPSPGVSVGASPAGRFHGCETTGLNASELHDLPTEEVREKMMDATKRLLGRGAPVEGSGSKVKAICLGCAGMVGLEEAVRSACGEELGPDAGKEVHIVDGVKAGVGVLYGLAKGGF